MDRSNSNILAQIVKDQSGKSILDCPEKIVAWIEHKFEEQKIQDLKIQQPHTPRIDLSNCVVYTQTHDGKPSMTNLCDIAGKIDCVIDTIKEKNKFHQEVLISIHCFNSVIYSPFFHQTKFLGDVRIEDTIIIGNGSFGNCQFDGYFCGQNTDFGQCDFAFSEFYKSIYFSRAKFSALNIDFSRSTFYGDVFFNSVVLNKFDENFKPSFRFNQSVFYKNLFVNNTDLNRPCFFEKCQFQGNISLNKSTSSDIVSFISSSITSLIISTEGDKLVINELDLSNINLLGRVDIEGYKINSIKALYANFKDSCILRIYDCHINVLNFYSLVNSGLICLIDNQNNINEISLKNAINKGYIEVENTLIPKITDRKTARLLKDSALKSNNHIDAVEYKRLEAKEYKKEKDIKWHECLLFSLNGFSNKHGTSWIRALWVTLLVTIFFSLLIICFGQVTISDEANTVNTSFFYKFFKTFIGILNIVNFEGNFKEINLNTLGYYLLYISKILITYGYYQFISAFRKYGK